MTSFIYYTRVGNFILENVNFETYSDTSDFAFNVALFMAST
jgi:hypothetical protein